MKCPRCQHDNPSQAKFCLECGARVALTCAKCRSELPGGAKFCLECGEPVASQTGTESRLRSPASYTPKHLAEKILTSKAALEGERKQVTVLFADLKGSMELLADRDPEEARKLLDPVLEHMMEAVHRYEGTVNQVMGDGIMALFGAPLAHEDHAVRACYAALRMQELVKRYAEGLRREQGVTIRIRVGLNSGEVVVWAIGSDLHMDYTAVGQTTHLAARMEQLADPGSILLTPDTLALAEGFVQMKSLGPMAVKGLLDRVEVYVADGGQCGAISASGRRDSWALPFRGAGRRGRAPPACPRAGRPGPGPDRGRRPNLQTAEYVWFTGGYSAFKLDQAPFNYVRVRRAMGRASNWKEILETNAFSQGHGAPNMVVPAAASEWVIPLDQLTPEGRETYEQDTAAARHMLAQAGYPNGFKTTVESTGGYGLFRQILGRIERLA